jgi:hypothetical protein
MAQIDPNIALGFRLPQIQDPIAAASRAQEFGVNALKMQEYERGIAQENKLRELISSGADLNSPETIRQMYSISPKMGAAFEKDRATLRKEQTATDKNLVDLEAGYMKNARDTLSAVGDQNSYSAWREQTIKRLPGLANMIPPQYSPQAKIALMADANKYLDQTQITAAQQAQMGVTMRGQNISAETARRGQDMARIPSGFRMTPEGTLEAIPGGPTTTSLSPKEMQQREAKFPQATQAVKTFEAKTTELEKDLIALRDHPGLASITGIAAGRAPGITKDGRAAQVIYDRILARGGFKELQDMRAASPTGGALGNVSNQEGQFLRQAFSGIDRVQDKSDVQKAIDQTITDLQGSKQRVREAYDMTYDYKGLGGGDAAPTPPPAPSGNTVTIPGGKVLTFPTPEAAAAYRQAAGL